MDLDPKVIQDLAEKKNWLGVIAFVLYATVRLLKSDTKIPIDIPPKWRALLALVLGVAAGIVMKASMGIGWQPAVIGGVLSAMAAITFHDVVIGGARGGKEIPIPGLMIPGAKPSPNAPPSTPPPPDDPATDPRESVDPSQKG